MSVLFNDAQFNTRTPARSRSTTGLWLSVVIHATFVGVLLAVVPTRASEKPSTLRPRSISVFSMPATELPALRSIPVVAPRLPSPPVRSRPVREAVIAEVPKAVAVAPIAARRVEPVAATLPPAAAPVFERPVETAAIERPAVTGAFERTSGPRTTQQIAAITTGGFGAVAPSPRGAVNETDVRAAGFDRRASASVQSSGAAAPARIDRPVEI